MPRNTQNTRGGNRRGGSKNNNPEGHNQYNNGLLGMARERPAMAAATAAGAVAAGVFLWSKRAQISDQLTQLSDQIGEWTDTSRNRELELVGGDPEFSGSTVSGTSSGGTTGGGRRGASSTASGGRTGAAD